MFCEKCGKILKIENNNEEVKGICDCGFSKIMVVESSEEIIRFEKGKGAIEDKNIMATFPHKCSKCGYDKAQVIELGVWFSDEAGVVRYKCGKCGFAQQDKDSNT